MDLPAVAVSRVHVDPELHQELDDLRVAGAHGVVQGGDAFVVGLTGVLHLTGRRVGESRESRRKWLCLCYCSACWYKHSCTKIQRFPERVCKQKQHRKQGINTWGRRLESGYGAEKVVLGLSPIYL